MGANATQAVCARKHKPDQTGAWKKTTVEAGMSQSVVLMTPKTIGTAERQEVENNIVQIGSPISFLFQTLPGGTSYENMGSW
eukprot:1847272-Amphidinium_carterae.1